MNVDKSVICPILIGREVDLLLLEGLRTQAQAGKGQIALISGEAGIGKSRLVREAKARAPHGTLILEGYCFQTESILPYAPLLDLFRSFFLTHSREQIARALGTTAPYLVKLFPELTATLPDLAPFGMPGTDPETDKRRIFQALLQTIVELASGQPVIMILEDLHWSDSTSLEFLLLLARRIASQPILLLLTYRDDETTPELTHFLAGLDRERLGTEFALRPMSPSQVDQMLQAILDSPQSPVSKEFLNAIVPLTEGNPFFIEEVLKSLLAEGTISFVEAGGSSDRKEINPLHIPRTVQDAVQRRMQQLNPGTLQALILASVMGRRFDFHLLQELLKVNEADLMRILKELINAQLVVEESADHFAFRHALTREAIYTTLLLRERQGLHRAGAEAIERVYAGSLAAHAADLSFHYYSGGAWKKALEYSRQAAEQARSLYAQREAVVYLSRALVSARQLDIALEPALLGARGQAYELLGDVKSALDDFERALHLARQAGNREAEWQALVDLGEFWKNQELGRAGEFFRQAEELARKLDQPRLRARSLNNIGNWYFMTGETLQGLQCHRQALEFFEGEGNEEGMAETLDLLGMATLHHGDQIGSYEHYQQAIHRFRGLANKHRLIPSLVAASHTLYDETDLVPPQTRLENEEMAMEAVELGRQIGWPSGESFAEWNLAIGLANWGRFEEALAHAGAALRIANEIEHRQRIAGAHYALGHIYLLMLQADLAIRDLERALELAREFGSAWQIGSTTTDLVYAYLLKGKLDRARALLDSAIRKESGHHTRSERRMLWAKGHLLLAEDKAGEALHIAEHLLDSKHIADFDQPIPGLLKLKGEALMAVGRWDEAEQALQAARQGAEQRELLPLLWQIHRLLGWLHKQQKNMEKSEKEFASARRVLEALAAQIQDEGLRAGFLHAALETLPQERKLTKRQSEAEKFGGLTSREREVAWYLAQGKSNREIAEGLVLSERTVESHVGNILTKLGFDSRAQIAVWAVETGLGKKDS